MSSFDLMKPSLKLGMVDLSKQYNHRDNESKTSQVHGRNNWKGIGMSSDPWDYDPDLIKRGS